MKKYLMTGIAAVAMCAAFTSCSHDIEPMSQEEIDQFEAEKAFKKYEAAFIATFGQPAANQNWGFGPAAAARTRAEINVNGNEEKYNDCPTRGQTEEADVVAYVQSLATKPNTNPINLQNYFVTQIHCGTETYTSGDGGAGIKGSAHMDHLQIAMEEGGTITSAGALSSTGNWMHINNFNRGDNTDWNGNTLVENGGTYNFAYNGSEDSKYHDRWIAIDGKNVQKTGGGNYDGYYYVCFDFVATVAGYTQITNAKWYNEDSPNGDKWENISGIKLPGKWTAEAVAASDLVYEVSYDVYINGVKETRTKTIHFNNPEEVKDIQVSNFVGGNMEISPNSSYLDWIVRLVKAEPKNTNPDPKMTSIRIMAEDLSATESSDFDFNDVVFDVIANEGGTSATIILQAAGGTLPLRINANDEWEVHDKFGVARNVMVNTNYLNKNINSATVGAVTLGTINGAFDENNFYKTAKAIKVEVQKGGQWMELTANTGQAACKFGCTTDKHWVPELENIDNYYDFSAWVQGFSATLTQTAAQWW